MCREKTIYEKYIKRILDFVIALLVLIVFCWLYIIVAVLVRMKLGSPVLFKQKRPGLNEKIYTMYKFRTMTDARNQDGELLSDEERLTAFGKWLRSTSLDELPEMFNILNGTMSLVGPRPQLVRDMVFMSEKDRARHSAKPGLTGLAQINGRNNISWEEKFEWDLRYIQRVSFVSDIKIVFMTIGKILKKEDITQAGMATAMDYGDYLLQEGKVSKEIYELKQIEAQKLLEFNK